ncbi:hypothetical protein, partial [Vibrio parahaemolyticus]
MEIWQISSTEVSDVTNRIDQRVETIQTEHSKLLATTSTKINDFIANELSQIEDSRHDLSGYTQSLDNAYNNAKSETSG